jgi:hypothetical protein
VTPTVNEAAAYASLAHGAGSWGARETTGNASSGNVRTVTKRGCDVSAPLLTSTAKWQTVSGVNPSIRAPQTGPLILGVMNFSTGVMRPISRVL